MHSSSQKTRLNDLSYDIEIWTDLSTILSQSTHLTDRRTDGQTDRQTDRILMARPRLHSMQRGKNVSYTEAIYHTDSTSRQNTSHKTNHNL